MFIHMWTHKNRIGIIYVYISHTYISKNMIEIMCVYIFTHGHKTRIGIIYVYIHTHVYVKL